MSWDLEESNPPKALRAEHLFKLNEAVFNLSEEDAVDGALAMKLFQAVIWVHQDISIRYIIYDIWYIYITLCKMKYFLS